MRDLIGSKIPDTNGFTVIFRCFDTKGSAILEGFPSASEVEKIQVEHYFSGRDNSWVYPSWLSASHEGVHQSVSIWIMEHDTKGPT